MWKGEGVHGAFGEYISVLKRHEKGKGRGKNEEYGKAIDMSCKCTGKTAHCEDYIRSL